MYLYWRIIEELKYLGETWIIRDPSLLRRYKSWTKKHAEAIAGNNGEVKTDSSGLMTYKGVLHSIN
jgi:hypothetical protein